MAAIVREVKKRLREAGRPEAAQASARFFKNDAGMPRFHGVKSAEVRAIARQTRAGLKGMAKADIFALCETLWQSGFMEEAGVACEWAYALRKSYAPEDMAVFRYWLEHYVGNWAACDVLCTRCIGDLLLAYPELVQDAIGWTEREGRWLQRGAAVSLINPAGKGLFLQEAFIIADRLMESDDDLVQKGYGWLLKVASKPHPDAVYAYLMQHRQTMPRTAFRYALEKFPADMRRKAMVKK